MTLDSDDRPGTTATEVGDPPHVGGRIVVSVSGLSKSYGEVEAVRGIDFEVAAGETFGFLGPNGAGKTTTIKILCTLARPTSGSARVAGYDVVGERDEVRRNSAWCSRTPPSTAISPQRRTCASTPTCIPFPRPRWGRGCGRCSTWSGCGTGATAW